MSTISAAASSAGSLRAAVFNHMCEVSCLSAHAAHEILGRFPEYRPAKDDPKHAFWKQNAREMLQELQKCEEALVGSIH